MTLQDIFDQLKYGELSQISIGGNDQGVLDENNWEPLIAHINLGLMALYKRFFLKEGRVTVKLLPDKTRYLLHSDYSVLSQRRPAEEKYILDTADNRFDDDILKVEEVMTDAGFTLFLNNAASPYSVFTPTTYSLRVPSVIVNQGNDLPDTLKTENLELVYRANHPKIVVPLGYFDPDRVEIELPASHLEALLFYVASRVSNPIGMTNEFHAGNSWFARYEQACLELENKNLQIDQGMQHTRFERNGWV